MKLLKPRVCTFYKSLHNTKPVFRKTVILIPSAMCLFIFANLDFVTLLIVRISYYRRLKKILCVHLKIIEARHLYSYGPFIYLMFKTLHNSALIYFPSLILSGKSHSTPISSFSFLNFFQFIFFLGFTFKNFFFYLFS